MEVFHASFGTFCVQIGQLQYYTDYSHREYLKILENRQVAVIEAKCRRFRNSSECLNIRRASNN